MLAGRNVDDASSQPLLSAEATSGYWRRSFYVMCFTFGLNHAAVTTPIAYASSLLGADLGQASNATLYVVCMMSSLFLGPLSSNMFGPKWGLCFGMFCYIIYVACFAIATSFETDSLGAWYSAIGGSLIGGIGAGSLWTCQGALFAALCGRIADTSSTPLDAVTSELSSVFAIFYLGQECILKVLFTVMQKYAKLPDSVGFLFYAALALSAMVCLAFSGDARPITSQQRPSLCAKASSAVVLWGDHKLWLIAGLNLSFGFSASYVNGYINSTWLDEALGADGSDFIGFLGAIVCLIATISSVLYGMMSKALGSKVPAVFVGSGCFLGIVALSFVQAPNGKGPAGWGWGIVVFYVLHGLGRGVYESTNKGIFADFFPGQNAMGAFANCMMQNTAASSVGFLLGATSRFRAEALVLLGCSILTVPCLLLANMQRSNAEFVVKLESP